MAVSCLAHSSALLIISSVMAQVYVYMDIWIWVRPGLCWNFTIAYTCTIGIDDDDNCRQIQVPIDESQILKLKLS